MRKSIIIDVVRLKTHVVKIAQQDFARHYGLKLTDEQTVVILSQDVKLLKEFSRYNKFATGFDTFDREALPYLLCKYFKIDKHWPINGDNDDYKRKFFEELELCCAAEGMGA